MTLQETGKPAGKCKIQDWISSCVYEVVVERHLNQCGCGSVRSPHVRLLLELHNSSSSKQDHSRAVIHKQIPDETLHAQQKGNTNTRHTGNLNAGRHTGNTSTWRNRGYDILEEPESAGSAQCMGANLLDAFKGGVAVAEGAQGVGHAIWP